MKVYKNEKAKQQIHNTYDKLLALWNTDFEEMDIPTYAGATHIITCGKEENPPLILFHGVGDDSALMWLYNAEYLAQYFRVYAVDTIGGPGKSCPNEHYNKDYDDVKWIDEVLSALGLEQVYVAGQSNGTYLTQLYAANRPDTVRKAVCLAGSVPVGDFGSMKIMMKIFLPEALFPTRKNAIKLLKKLCGKNHAAFTDHPIVLEHFHALLKGFNNMAMQYHRIIHLTDGQIDSIRDKALYLVGESDPFAALGGKASLLQYKMNAQFFPDAGHGINHEIADTINRLLVEYLLS